MNDGGNSDAAAGLVAALAAGRRAARPVAGAGGASDAGSVVRYSILVPSNRAGALEECGQLQLRRQPLDAGRFRLIVRQTISYENGRTHELHSIMGVRTGAGFDTLENWRSESRFYKRTMPLENLTIAATGWVKAGWKIEIRTDDSPHRIKTPRAVTTNWLLLDAVQRLARRSDQWHQFDMLEETFFYRPGQRLSYHGSQPFLIGGEPVDFHRFVLLGYGILPHDFWLDQSGRTVFVRTATRGYLRVA